MLRYAGLFYAIPIAENMQLRIGTAKTGKNG